MREMSAPTSGGEISFTITAIDDASEAIDQVQGSVSQLTTSVQSVGPAMSDAGNATGAATTSMGGFNQQTMWGLQGMQGLANVVRASVSDFETLQMTHMRLEAAQLTAQKAQESYTEAVKKFGPASQEAVDAHQKLQDALDRVNYYQEKSELNWVMIATQIPMVVGSIGQLIGGLGPLSTALFGTVEGGSALVPLLAAGGPIILGILAVVAAIAILYEAWTNDWGGIREKTAEAVKDLENAFLTLGKDLDGFGKAVEDAIGGAINWLKSNWQDVLVATLMGPVGLAYEAWKNNWGGFRDIVSNAMKDASDAINAAGNWIKDGMNTIGNVVGGVWNGIVDVVTKNTQVSGSAIQQFASTNKDAAAQVQSTWSALGQTLADDWNGIVDATTKAWNSIKDTVNTQLPLLGGIIQVGMDLIHGDWQKAWQDLVDLPSKLLTQMQNDIANIMNAIKASIKVFTDAFQAAEDLLKPIIAAITTALTDFLNAVQKLFKSFYDWLVGASLWSDLWNAVMQITKNAGNTLGQIITDMFNVLSGLFKGGVDLLGMILVTGFQVAFATIQTIVSSAVSVLSGLLKSFEDLIGGVRSTWDDMVTDVSTSLASMRSDITDFWSWLQDYWSSQVNQLVSVTQSGFQKIQQAVQSTTQETVAPTQSAMSAVTSTFQGAFNTISNAATGFYSWLVGGSLWPDMMNKMQTTTTTTTDAINSAVLNMFSTVQKAAQATHDQLFSLMQEAETVSKQMQAGGAVPTQFDQLAAAMNNAYAAQQKLAQPIQVGSTTLDLSVVGAQLAQYGYWNPPAGLNLTGNSLATFAQALADATFQAKYGRSQALGPYGSQPGDKIVNNISVQVDGTTVAKTVQTQMVSQRQTAGVA
jgi:phage-related protein